MNDAAWQALKALGIEHQYRLGVETVVSGEYLELHPNVGPKRVTEELSYRIANVLVEGKKLTRSERPETRVYKNVPEPSGNIINRAETVIFHPHDFELFLEEYRKNVIQEYQQYGGNTFRIGGTLYAKEEPESGA